MRYINLKCDRNAANRPDTLNTTSLFLNRRQLELLAPKNILIYVIIVPPPCIEVPGHLGKGENARPHGEREMRVWCVGEPFILESWIGEADISLSFVISC